ncbi:PAS domain S-box protein [Mongoliibacter sp.]|uniref:PAS domain S-box protein n=1 Tax=Mongoliibacter sp. TaxID=2022438 RepID=UPI0025F46035|nr:PAS domain S-box protein [Mongoliibacter sp.]
MQRLTKLRSLNILDTLPEEEYDDITSLAAFICQTPISLITLIDEKEIFFKSCSGIDLDKIPLDESVCKYVFDNPNEPLIIPDLGKDDRFKDLPILKNNPDLTFYAGFPIVMDGIVLGALCVLDSKPRQLGDEQLLSIKKLQNQVVKLLELRLTEIEKQAAIDKLEQEYSLRDNLVENINGIFWEADAQTFEFSYVSAQVKNILGFTQEEWLSNPIFWADHIHPEDKEFAVDFCHNMTRKLEDHSFEYRMLTKSGRYIWVLDKVKVLEKDGKPNKLNGFLLDISKEKELEFKLKEEVNLVRRIIDQLPIPFYLFDEKGKHILWNKVLLDYAGYSEEEFQYVKPLQLYKGKEFDKIKYAIEQVYKVGTEEVEAIMTSKSGNQTPFYFKASRIDYYGQNCIFGVGMDMSRIKEADKQLKLNERKYKALVEEGSDLLFLLDLNANILEIGQNIKQKLGYDSKDMVGKNGFDFFHSDDRERVQSEFEKLKDNRIVQSSPYRFLHKKGYYLWYQSTGTNLIEDEAVQAIVVNSMDITQVMESERRFKTLVQDGGDLISILDKSGKYLYVSPTSENILGILPEQLLGKNAFDYIHKEDLNRVKFNFEHLFYQKRLEIEPFRFVDIHGNWRWLETVATNMIADPLIEGIVVNSRDITDKYEAQQKLAKSEARYRVFFESQTNYVIRTDLEGNYTYSNKKFLDEFGWVYDGEPIGKSSLKSICDYHHNKVKVAVQKCISSPETIFKVELDKPGKENTTASTLWDFVCLCDSHGNPSEIQCSGIDITERISAEKELKKVNEMFELLNEASSESLYEYLPDEKELYLAKSFERIFFHERKPLKDNLDFIQSLRYSEDDLEVREKFYSTVYDSFETTLTVKYRLLNGKGEYRWVQDTAVILRDDDGKAKRVIGTLKDITEFQKMTILLNLATKVSRLGGWDLNLMNNKLIWNAITCDLHGVPHDFQPDIESALNFHREDYRDLLISEINRAIDYRESFDFESIIITAEGEEKWVRVIGNPEVIDGKSVRIYGSVQDIHERKTAEQSIRASNERFEIISRATNDAIWDYDLSQDKLFWGAGFKTLFGYDPKEIAPDFHFLISKIHPEDKKRVTSKMFQLLSGKVNEETWNQEYRFLKSDGSYAYVSDQAIFIRNADGVATRALGALSDITPRKEFEESLKNLNQKLEKSIEELALSNQELEQFAYVASHDLQEPLRMISSFMGLLEKKYGDLLDDKGKQYIHFAKDGASRMKHIMLDLLEFSRVGRHEDDLKEIKVKNIIDDVMELNKRLIQEKEVQFKIGKLPTIKSYKMILMQIFQNLIGNAIKYNNAQSFPEVEISAEETPDFWEFKIKDNGIGIEEQHYQRIFNLFQRLHSKNEYSGSGIGLAIVKKNVELLGGRVEVISELGKGSTFSFTLKK